MSDEPRGSVFASSNSEYEAIRTAAARLVDFRAGLPLWPFSGAGGWVDACDFEWCRDDRFEPVLSALAQLHGDSTVSVQDVPFLNPTDAVQLPFGRSRKERDKLLRTLEGRGE